MALGPGYSLCSYKCPLFTLDETVLVACNITCYRCILLTLTIMIIEKFYIDQLFLLHYDNRRTIILCKYPTFLTGMLDHLMKYLHLLFRLRKPSIRNRHCISVSSS